LKLLAKEGALQIIFAIEKNGKMQFKDLTKVVESQTTLIRRLNELTSYGILNRKLLDTKYRPTEYTLTDHGKKIVKVLKQLYSAA